MNFKQYITEQYWKMSRNEILRLKRLTHEDMINLLRAKKAGNLLSYDEENILKAYFPELRQGETFMGKDGRRWKRTSTGVEPA